MAIDEKQRTHRIDIHAHLLPEVDDGARTIEEACELVGLAVKSGFDAIVVTPHYSRRRGADGYSERFEQLNQIAAERFPGVQLYLGQETFYHEELTENLKHGKALTMAGSRYVLVEFDPGVSFQILSRGLRQMLTAGYVPILAHMERYRCLRDKKNMSSICGSGCLMQMNYESLEGYWFSREVRWCRKQVLEGRIQFLGTDMHRTDYRPPEIKKAMNWLERAAKKKKLSKRLLKDMTGRNARKMIQNDKIE